MHSISDSKLTDSKLIETSRKYRMDPGGLKCKVFTLFDQGYSTIEVAFLLRKYQDPKTPRSYRATVRKYHVLWKKEQGA